jgi:hypothetical protein
VRVGDDPIVRSYPGANGAWCRHVTGLSRGRIRAGGVERDVTFTATTPQSSEIDRTYRAKYSRYAGS